MTQLESKTGLVDRARVYATEAQIARMSQRMEEMSRQ